MKQDSNSGIPDSDGKIPLHWAASSHDGNKRIKPYYWYGTRIPIDFAISNNANCMISNRLASLCSVNIIELSPLIPKHTVYHNRANGMQKRFALTVGPK